MKITTLANLSLRMRFARDVSFVLSNIIILVFGILLLRSVRSIQQNVEADARWRDEQAARVAAHADRISKTMERIMRIESVVLALQAKTDEAVTSEKVHEAADRVMDAAEKVEEVVKKVEGTGEAPIR